MIVADAADRGLPIDSDVLAAAHATLRGNAARGHARNAANAAAARSIQMSSSGHLTDIAKSHEIQDSKSLGFFEQSRKLGQVEQNQVKDEKKDQLMKGANYFIIKKILVNKFVFVIYLLKLKFLDFWYPL